MSQKLSKGKGPVSTILISNGNLKEEIFICGDTWGKIRAMINYEGKGDEALPSMPVEILGMNSSAYAGQSSW